MSAETFPSWTFASWAIDALVASTLLIILVLLVRVPVRRAFGPVIAYWLWALPLLRLVMPPLPASWRKAAATPISRAGETITVYIVEPGSRAVAAAGDSTAATGPSLGLILAVLWVVGAAGFLAFHIVRHGWFCRRVLARGRVIRRIGDIDVLVSAGAPGPLAFGIWRRYVAFPADVAERYDAEEQALALAHELGHHQRGDLLANWLALIVLALHWFNPLVWHAFHAFRADQELANDARVVGSRSPALRYAYGRAIVKAAHGGSVSAACHLHTVSDLKGRLRMLARSPASRGRLLSGGGAVVALVVAGLGLTASGSSASVFADEVKHSMGVPQDVPEPGPAPASPTATKRIVVVRDGQTRTYEGSAADAYLAEHPEPVPPQPPVPPEAPVPHAPPVPPVAPVPPVPPVPPLAAMPPMPPVPDVRSKRCPGDDAHPVVIHEYRKGRQRIIICSNRIEAQARQAQRLAVDAEQIAHQARAQARVGLVAARSAIERDRNLSAEQRREALEGIAEGEADLARDDD